MHRRAASRAGVRVLLLPLLLLLPLGISSGVDVTIALRRLLLVLSVA